MVNQILVITITYIVMFFLSAIVLWKISKRQKLKKHNLKTAFLAIGIPIIVSLFIYFAYQLITFHIILKILISIFTFVFAFYLIKEFYKVNWWKAIKIYLLTILITALIIWVIMFVITALYAFLTPFFH